MVVDGVLVFAEDRVLLVEVVPLRPEGETDVIGVAELLRVLRVVRVVLDDEVVPVFRPRAGREAEAIGDPGLAICRLATRRLVVRVVGVLSSVVTRLRELRKGVLYERSPRGESDDATERVVVRRVGFVDVRCIYTQQIKTYKEGLN